MDGDISIIPTDESYIKIQPRRILLRYIHWIRQQEFDAVKDWLMPQACEKVRLLEIGGGDGFLAKRLAEMGLDVVSIDIEPRQPSYFPVRKGDCTHLDFNENSFDIIFSSHVLPFVNDLGDVFSEMKRVLKSDGIMVHTVPVHYGVIFSLILEPIAYLLRIGIMIDYILKFLASAILRPRKSIKNQTQSRKASLRALFNKQNFNLAFKYLNPVRFFIPLPLEPYRDCFSEIIEWRRQTWQRKFQETGFQIKAFILLPMAFSGHGIFPFRLIKLRRWLASRGLSSSVAYLLKKII